MYSQQKYAESVLDSIKRIDLCSEKIEKIEPGAFNGLTLLVNMHIDHNAIVEIPDRLFETLISLKVLSFDNNKLKRINKETFKGLTNLDKLFLRNNEISEIAEGAFENLSNLSKLKLDNNNLMRIDKETFKGLENTVSLTLNNNQISKIAVGAFQNMAKLTELYLNNNKLKRIERTASERSSDSFSSLVVLKLNNNKLKKIDRKSWAGLNSIAVIQIYGNDPCLKALSYYNKCKATRYFNNYDDDRYRIRENGFLKDWILFLSQFEEKQGKKSRRFCFPLVFRYQILCK